MDMHPNGKDTSQGGNPKDHLGEADLLLYLEGGLEETEALVIQRHLNTCSHCLGLVASAHRETLTLKDKKEVNALLANVDLDVEKQLQRLVDTGLVKPDKSSPGPAPAVSFIVFWAGIWQALRQHSRPYVATAGSLVAVALLMFFVGVPQYLTWKSDSLVNEGVVSLRENLTLNDRAYPRPAGEIPFNPFGGRRRGSAEFSGKSEAALMKFQDSLVRNKNNAKAHQYIGTYFLIDEENVDSARVHYNLAFENDSTDASILNDLGVLAWREAKYNEALQYYLKALEIEPEHLEAHYNIALLYQAIGDFQNAKTAWQKYRRLDAHSAWTDYADKQLQILSENRL